MSDENYEIEDLLSNFNKKKIRKKNTSKRKGNSGERELADILKERFDKKFFRVTGSGNRWSQVDLSEETKGVFTGDIVCPFNFKFVVECKYGYADIEMCSIFSEGHKQFDEWLKKVRRDADSLKKSPIVCWRKPHYEWLAFIPYGLFLTQFKQHTIYLKYIQDEEWAIMPLKKLLDLSNDFWFESALQDKI